jgi:hypothetical protein
VAAADDEACAARTFSVKTSEVMGGNEVTRRLRLYRLKIVNFKQPSMRRIRTANHSACVLSANPRFEMLPDKSCMCTDGKVLVLMALKAFQLPFDSKTQLP